MDDFVRSTLIKWDLADLIEKFRDEEVDQESLLCLGDRDIDQLILKAGPRARFKKRLQELKSQQMDVLEGDLEQVLSSSSTACENEQVLKRKLDLQPRSNSPAKIKRQCDTAPGSDKDDFILNKVKGIMGGVHDRLSNHTIRAHSQQMDVLEGDLEQVLSSSSTACENEQVLKRKLDLQPRSNSPAKIKRQCDTAPGSDKDDFILNKVKDIMRGVHDRLSNHTNNTKLNAFLRNKIWDLLTDKKELVGVFGKTGAGKSSLINAVVQEKDLLPSGELTACTTVMIKVEANTLSKKYEAEIEFISKEEWKDELWSVKNLFGNEEMEDAEDNTGNNPDEEKDDDEEYNDNIEKMTALYGEEWKIKSPENLMEAKYFKEIPEFLKSQRKIVDGRSAKELSAKVLKYTRTDVNEAKESKRCFWPLVKCVTVRVPNNDFLKHVTLVDLPGNGDRNKSRDQMWKKVVASCSTVWIVSEMNRAVADRDAWDILKSACALMGNGGECQHIYFICTKSDHVNEEGSNILKNNSKAKELVRKEFTKQTRVKKQFSDDCFDVFTVSSKEFLKSTPKYLQRDETEIPKLQDLLRNLNDQHDLTLNYVSGAYGILSLIQGAKQRNVDSEQTVLLCENLIQVMKHEIQKVRKSMEDEHGELEKCLRTGVEQSKNLCEVALKKILNPRGKGRGRGFHRQLKCALKNKGVHKAKKKEINLNNALSNYLTDSIDEKFRKMFPNDAKTGPFYGTIHAFSLDTTGLVQQYKRFELLLTFLKTEEAKIKTRLCKNIRDCKKVIYSSLTETVTEAMQECYTKAADIRGTGSLQNMRSTVERHFHDVKDTMFDHAKDVVLSQLKDLTEHVQKELRDSLFECTELSFNSDDRSIPDFGNEFDLVKKHYDELTGQNKEDLSWPDLLD